MTHVKRSWDLISDEKRRSMVTAIVDYFTCERDQEIGVVAAEEILDFMLQSMAPDLYNKGVEDSLSFFKKHFEALEPEMAALVKK